MLTSLEGWKALATSWRVHLAANITPKGEDKPVDLKAGEAAQFLGFTLCCSNTELILGLGDEAWRHLELRLAEAHFTDDPPTLATQAIKGWIAAFGPAFNDNAIELVQVRLLRTLANIGFREAMGSSAIICHCNLAWNRWQEFCSCKSTRTVAGTRGL